MSEELEALREAYEELKLGKSAKEAWAEVKSVIGTLEAKKAAAADEIRKMMADAKKEADVLKESANAYRNKVRKDVDTEMASLKEGEVKFAEKVRADSEGILEAARAASTMMKAEAERLVNEASVKAAAVDQLLEAAKVKVQDALSAEDKAKANAAKLAAEVERVADLRARIMAALEVK